LYFDQSCRAFCAGGGQYGIARYGYVSRKITYRHLQCVVFARHCAGDIWLDCTRALVVSSPYISPKSRKMAAGVRRTISTSSPKHRHSINQLATSASLTPRARPDTSSRVLNTTHRIHTRPPYTKLHFGPFNHFARFYRIVHAIHTISPTR
jgi:hypothetical protein